MPSAAHHPVNPSINASYVWFEASTKREKKNYKRLENTQHLPP